MECGSPAAAGRTQAPAGPEPIHAAPNHDEVLPYLTLVRPRAVNDRPIEDRPAHLAAGGGSNLDAHHDRESIADAHAVEFSKTAKPLQKGNLSEETDRTLRPEALVGQPASIALRGPQASEASLADLQHLPVRARVGDVVLTGRKLGAAKGYAALVYQPAGL